MIKTNTEFFDNIEIAYASKSDKELKVAYRLFRIINNALMVNFGIFFFKSAMKIHLPVFKLLKPLLFHQFIGGESLLDCEKTSDKLFQYNIGTILDYSVEGKSREEDFIHAAQEIAKAIGMASGNPKIPFVVLKTSGLMPASLLERAGLKNALSAIDKKAYEAGIDRIEFLCKVANTQGVRLLIDAEESWIQHNIDTICRQMMEKYNKHKAIVYTTVQMYRQDRVNFLVEAYSNAVVKDYRLGIKVVRGAYMEKERKRAAKMAYTSPIHLSKKDTDQDYHVALRFCMKHLNRIALCVGTHNPDSILLLMRIMEEIKLNPDHDHVYFAQLLGMSDVISYNLAQQGYNVSKYVPYGPLRDVFPYLMRRAQENTAVTGQMSRELQLVKKEILRRKRTVRPSFSDSGLRPA